jgi:Protein of unknown function (DUF3000)
MRAVGDPVSPGQPGTRDAARPGRSGPPDDPSRGFGVLVDGLREQRTELCAVCPELSFEDVPAPRTLAPFATAMAATVEVGETEVASGRLVLLYDPAGQDGWAGPLRIIVYIRAELDPEIAADPLIGQVGWSWLTEALANRTAGYAEPSGTVTRVVTEGFGAKQAEAAITGFELRASWSPAGPGGPAGAAGSAAGPAAPVPDGQLLDGHVAAWCDALCAAAGLPPLAWGVAVLRRPESRRPR